MRGFACVLSGCRSAGRACCILCCLRWAAQFLQRSSKRQLSVTNPISGLGVQPQFSRDFFRLLQSNLLASRSRACSYCMSLLPRIGWAGEQRGTPLRGDSLPHRVRTRPQPTHPAIAHGRPGMGSSCGCCPRFNREFGVLGTFFKSITPLGSNALARCMPPQCVPRVQPVQ